MQNATAVQPQSTNQKKGEMVWGPMATVPYPPEGEDGDDPIGITVRFPKDEYEDYKLIADFWNAVDRFRGVERRHKWKPSSVLREAARALRKQLKDQLADWPKVEAEQTEYVRRLSAAQADGDEHKPK